MKRLAAFVFVILVCAGVARGDDFGDHWYDGKAELDGYRLKVSRYGQERQGTAVMIYVTEPFSESKRVKVNDADANPDDTFNVLKLNLVRDFQTGIYDYNTMVSVFSRVTDFSPVKLTFSSSEWCGQVYEELIFHDKIINGHYYSYFEDESGPRKLDRPAGSVSEDNLYILLRGLRGPYLEPGASRTLKLLPSVFFGRLSHKPLAWADATIEHLVDTESVEVPAGRFETTVYTLEVSDGRKGTFYIEREYPHRIVKWSMLPDIEGVLTGSDRLAYWRLNGNGNESYLEKLGLGRP